MAKSYTLADFDYDLPAALIAQAPAASRSGSRLLHVDGARVGWAARQVRQSAAARPTREPAKRT